MPMSVTLEDFLAPWRGRHVPLLPLLRNHGLLALAHLADAHDRVAFHWSGPVKPEEDPIGRMLTSLSVGLEPRVLAVLLRAPAVAQRWRQHLRVEGFEATAAHVQLRVTLPLAVLLGLPPEPGLGQAVLQDLALLAQSTPGSFHLGISNLQSPDRVGLSANREQPAPPALTRWQAQVQEGLWETSHQQLADFSSGMPVDGMLELPLYVTMDAEDLYGKAEASSPALGVPTTHA
jgi:hypothetical protein